MLFGLILERYKVHHLMYGVFVRGVWCLSTSVILYSSNKRKVNEFAKPKLCALILKRHHKPMWRMKGNIMYF